MADQPPFFHLVTTTLAMTATTARVALSTTIYLGGNGRGRSRTVRLYNGGTTVCYVLPGDSTVTASATTGVPIGGGQALNLAIEDSVTHIAGIMGTGTGTLSVSLGEGGV